MRVAVGLIFLTQGVLKYADPNMGVNRFMRIGVPHPAFTAHMVPAMCRCRFWNPGWFSNMPD